MKAQLILIILSCCMAVHAKADDVNEKTEQVTISLHRSDEFDALQGEVMGEGPITEYLTGRAGLSFFLSDDTGLHGGIEGGVRGELPGLVSPFVGAGMFLGRWTDDELADSDGIDNDGDGIVDEVGEEEELVDYLAAVYPELGIHLWLTKSIRVTFSTRYYVTSKGRGSDRKMSGLGLAVRF